MASELGLVFLISWRLEAKSSNELLMDWKRRVALLEMSGLGEGDGRVSNTNHLKGAILLQCKPFTSREDQGLNWLSWEQKWWQAYQENTDLVFRKKKSWRSLPSPYRPPPPPPRTPCSGRSYKLWMWNISQPSRISEVNVMATRAKQMF